MPKIKNKKLKKEALIKKVDPKKAQKKVVVSLPPKRKLLKKKVEAPVLLPPNQARILLESIDGWKITDDHKMIYREFILRNFKAAVDLIDRIAVIAQKDNHHPDMHLTQYRNLRIGLTSHDLGGLSNNDLQIAQKINKLPKKLNHY